MLVQCNELGERISLNEYMDIFGNDEEALSKIVKKVEKIVLIRNTVIQEDFED